MQAVRDLGQGVHIGVVGFDDVDEARSSAWHLTSWAQRRDLLVAEALIASWASVLMTAERGSRANCRCVIRIMANTFMAKCHNAAVPAAIDQGCS